MNTPHESRTPAPADTGTSSAEAGTPAGTPADTGTSSAEAERPEIELRAEPAPRTIGDIPPALTRWGFAVILLLMAALLLALILIPYPYSSGESILRHILMR